MRTGKRFTLENEDVCVFIYPQLTFTYAWFSSNHSGPNLQPLPVFICARKSLLTLTTATKLIWPQQKNKKKKNMGQHFKLFKKKKELFKLNWWILLCIHTIHYKDCLSSRQMKKSFTFPCKKTSSGSQQCVWRWSSKVKELTLSKDTQ